MIYKKLKGGKELATKIFYRTEKLLKEYTFLSKMIEQDKLLIKEFSYLKAVDHDKVTVQGTNQFYSETENLMISKIDIQNRLKKNSEKILKICAAIKLLDKVERSIIENYYFNNLGWDIVSYKECMSIRHCLRIRDEALSKLNLYLFAEMIDKKTGVIQLAMDSIKVE